jgi:hypothetical protein
LARERAKQSRTADVVEVRASIHTQPGEHPGWHELGGREKSRGFGGKSQNGFLDSAIERRKPKEFESDLETSFLFEQLPWRRCEEPEPPIGQDGILFVQ